MSDNVVEIKLNWLIESFIIVMITLHKAINCPNFYHFFREKTSILMAPSHSDAALAVGIRDDGDSGVIETPSSSSSTTHRPLPSSSNSSHREKPSFWVNFIAGG